MGAQLKGRLESFHAWKVVHVRPDLAATTIPEQVFLARFVRTKRRVLPVEYNYRVSHTVRNT